ncbi:MAG: hypothetical protein IID31_10175 [Planctomycetes bacterium]|nr:hypothetical protein [Planctomycetota bacterium]
MIRLLTIVFVVAVLPIAGAQWFLGTSIPWWVGLLWGAAVAMGTLAEERRRGTP